MTTNVNHTPRPKGALALWYKEPEPERQLNFPSNLSNDQKVNLARARVERYREEYREEADKADDILWMKIVKLDREKAKAEYDRRHMMRSAIKDYHIPDYDEHRVYNEIMKRKEEIDREKKKGEKEEDVLRRLEKAEMRQVVEVMKDDWKHRAKRQDPIVQEARAKVAELRGMDASLKQIPDEMIWERVTEEEREAELERTRRAASAPCIDDIVEEYEKERIGRELQNRRCTIAKMKKRHESLEEALLRLERMDYEKIRLALRDDWNERYEN